MRRIETLLACVLLLSAPAHAENAALRDQCMEARAIVYRAQTIGELYELALVSTGSVQGIAEALRLAGEQRGERESELDFVKRLLAESLDDECGGDM